MDSERNRARNLIGLFPCFPNRWQTVSSDHAVLNESLEHCTADCIYSARVFTVEFAVIMSSHCGQ